LDENSPFSQGGGSEPNKILKQKKKKKNDWSEDTDSADKKYGEVQTDCAQ
jgi:hypothetical protein